MERRCFVINSDKKRIVSNRKFINMLTTDMSTEDIKEAITEGQKAAEDSINKLKHNSTQSHRNIPKEN